MFEILPDKLWRLQNQFHEMQKIFVVTKVFVMDLKYELCELEFDIYACWLKRSVEMRKEKKVSKWAAEN